MSKHYFLQTLLLTVAFIDSNIKESITYL